MTAVDAAFCKALTPAFISPGPMLCNSDGGEIEHAF